jgi:Protein of unknown function (DUF3102)
MKQKQKNARTLDTIADDIHELERGNIFDIGDLLLEAKAQCEHGQWLDWLEAEFEGSEDTAERKMEVAELGSRFRTLRNLKLGATTLYQLIEDEDEEDLPAIIAELAKHATTTILKPRDAKRVIKIGIGRRRFGDHPDATLVRLVETDRNDPWYEKVVVALQQYEPTTDEGAIAIVDETQQECEEAELQEAERKADPDYAAFLEEAEAAAKAKDEAEAEAEAENEAEAERILSGAPPVLPPPAPSPEPQKLHADTDWAETALFDHAVTDLRKLHAKPLARFAGRFTPAELREVADFLTALAAADKDEAA